MVTLTFIAYRKPGLSRPEALAMVVDAQHTEFTRALPGLREWAVNPAISPAELDWPDWTSELLFNNAEDAALCMVSPEMAAGIDDAARFADSTRSYQVVTGPASIRIFDER